MLFNGWMSLGRMVVVGLMAYVSLIILLRISGKRTLAKMNAFDLVVTVALGSTLSAVAMSKDVALAEGVAMMGLLIVCQYVVTWGSVRNDMVRRLVRGEPTLLAFKGEFIARALHSQRVTESEVRQAVRAHGVTNLESAVVILETDGSFSVLEAGEGFQKSDLPSECIRYE